jgi:hypothetical protein
MKIKEGHLGKHRRRIFECRNQEEKERENKALTIFFTGITHQS